MKYQKKPELIDAIQWDGTDECLEKIKALVHPFYHGDINKSKKSMKVGRWVIFDRLPYEVLSEKTFLKIYDPAKVTN